MKNQNSRTAEKDNGNERIEAVSEGDDDDDDWMIQQAQVWAAAGKEEKSTMTEKTTDKSNKKLSINTKKSSMECQVKDRMNKKRKLEDHKQERSTNISTMSDLSRKELPLLNELSQKQQGPQLYSLHLTQLSYDATDFDIREHFIRHGCMNIQSIRLVYDSHDTKGDGSKQAQKKFRGVAFVDIYMDTYESYEALVQQLHGSIMLQRKINVRPVKSKVELASIVQQTKLYVNQQIQIEKEKKKTKLNAMDVTKATTDSPAKVVQQRDSKAKWQAKKNSKALMEGKGKSFDGKADFKVTSRNSNKQKFESAASSSSRGKHNVALSKKKNDSVMITGGTNTHSKNSTNATKLTKQQRNRKAAILMQKRRERP
jgi:hypothetical protein